MTLKPDASRSAPDSPPVREGRYGDRVIAVEPGGAESIPLDERHGRPLQLLWTWTSPNDADGALPSSSWPDSSQDRDRAAVVQVVAHEAADGGHRGHGVPLRAFQQVLHLAGVASPACSAMLQQFRTAGAELAVFRPL